MGQILFSLLVVFTEHDAHVLDALDIWDKFDVFALDLKLNVVDIQGLFQKLNRGVEKLFVLEGLHFGLHIFLFFMFLLNWNNLAYFGNKIDETQIRALLIAICERSFFIHTLIFIIKSQTRFKFQLPFDTNKYNLIIKNFFSIGNLLLKSKIKKLKKFKHKTHFFLNACC